MAALMQSPDLTQFRAFSSGDEGALAQVFRLEYDALLEQGRAALGPDLAHFSGRVAQQAMLDTWARRAEFQSPDGLLAALQEAVKGEAAIQKRKHAALHTRENSSRAPHVAVPTSDQAVEQLLASLHATPVDHSKVVEEVKAARKAHAAEHVQAVARKRGWKVPAALIVILGVAIVGIMKWMNASGQEVAVTKALAADDARKVTSQRGQRGNIDLNDGSKARIGSDTRMVIPAAFGTTMRTLSLSGTATFTVAAGQVMPFVVRAGHAIVTATGTVFTVRAYDEDSAAFIMVNDGSVSVRTKDDKTETALGAGKAMRLGRDGTVTMLDDGARDLALGWVRDSLIFTNTPVSVVLPELGRWFDLKASLADPSLGTRPVTLTVGLQSSGDALKAFAGAAGLTIGFDKDDKVVLSAAPAKK